MVTGVGPHYKCEAGGRSTRAELGWQRLTRLAAASELIFTADEANFSNIFLCLPTAEWIS